MPELTPGAVRLLWVNDWYDAPTEAIVEHAGERCLLRIEDPGALADGASPRWVLYALDARERAEHERWHEEYVRHVGAHWCFHDDAVHPHLEVADTDEREPERFFGTRRNRAPVAPETLTPIGWLAALPAG